MLCLRFALWGSHTVVLGKSMAHSLPDLPVVFPSELYDTLGKCLFAFLFE